MIVGDWKKRQIVRNTEGVRDKKGGENERATER